VGDPTPGRLAAPWGSDLTPARLRDPTCFATPKLLGRITSSSPAKADFSRKTSSPSEAITIAIIFSSKSAAYGWLSNFSEHGFTIEGVRWRSVEHFYQAHKYVGTQIAARIQLAETPMKARKMGQDLSVIPRNDWDDVKESIMRMALLAKFDQNRRIREQLLETGDEELIHGSSSDQYWGRTDGGIGENRLGEILMEIRNELETQGRTTRHANSS